MNALSEAAVEMKPGEVRCDIETIFRAQYRRIARVIASVIRDPARAEDIAVEVFVKWSGNPTAQGENAEGWLYRVAVRMARNELRRRTRRSRYESLFDWMGGTLPGLTRHAFTSRIGGMPRQNMVPQSSWKGTDLRIVYKLGSAQIP